MNAEEEAEHERISKMTDEEKGREALKLLGEKHSVVMMDENGNKQTVKLNIWIIGKMFCNLEVLREIMGHSNIRYSLDYFHPDTPEGCFLKDVVLMSGRSRK